MKLTQFASAYFLFILLITDTVIMDRNENELSILSKIDYEGILSTHKIVGADFCKRGRIIIPCPIIENAYPVGIFEVARKPYHTKHNDAAGFLNYLRAKSGLKYSSHTSTSGYASNLHFAESRVFTFVPENFFRAVIASPHSLPFVINFVSEQNSEQWTNEKYENMLVSGKIPKMPCEYIYSRELSGCAGAWGSYYPRVGYINHPNVNYASALIALRGGRAASEQGLFSVDRYRFEPRTGHYIQVVNPYITEIIKIGSEGLKGLAIPRDGHYLYLHYGIFRFCPPCSQYGKLQPAR